MSTVVPFPGPMNCSGLFGVVVNNVEDPREIGNINYAVT